MYRAESVLLTFITVTKDDPSGLARTLMSTARWRTASVEHVVIDGSATPRQTARTLDEIGGEIRLEARPPHGIADAFNAGLRRARGDWIWFINGGDAVHETLEPGWLLNLLAVTRADVVTGSLHFDGESEARPLPPLARQWPLTACWLAHPATLVRRAALLRSGGFDERWQMAMDYDLWQRLLKEELIVDAVSVPFARFDINGISEHSSTRDALNEEEASVLRRHRGVLVKAWLRLNWRCGGALLRALRLRR